MKRHYRIIGIALFFAGMLASCVSAPRRTSCPSRGWWCRSVVEVEKPEVKEKAQSEDYALEYVALEESY